MVFRQETKIPKERVAVLIGTKGNVKKSLEKLAKARMTVDSEEGEIVIEGEDSILLYTLKDIIHAIGRGFSPAKARLLFDENYAFDLLEIKDYVGKSPKKMTRIKARLIGTKGKARQIIERLTNTYISVYGKTVGIIGLVEDVKVARDAIEYILGGAPHGNVFFFLERKRAESKKKRFVEEYGFGEVG